MIPYDETLGPRASNSTKNGWISGGKLLVFDFPFSQGTNDAVDCPSVHPEHFLQLRTQVVSPYLTKSMTIVAPERVSLSLPQCTNDINYLEELQPQNITELR